MLTTGRYPTPISDPLPHPARTLTPAPSHTLAPSASLPYHPQLGMAVPFPDAIPTGGGYPSRGDDRQGHLHGPWDWHCNRYVSVWGVVRVLGGCSPYPWHPFVGVPTSPNHHGCQVAGPSSIMGEYEEDAPYIVLPWAWKGGKWRIPTPSTLPGETAIVGRNVKLFHGVTLGSISYQDGPSMAGVKRHPTIEDEVPPPDPSHNLSPPLYAPTPANEEEEHRQIMGDESQKGTQNRAPKDRIRVSDLNTLLALLSLSGPTAHAQMKACACPTHTRCKHTCNDPLFSPPLYVLIDGCTTDQLRTPRAHILYSMVCRVAVHTHWMRRHSKLHQGCTISVPSEFTQPSAT